MKIIGAALLLCFVVAGCGASVIELTPEYVRINGSVATAEQINQTAAQACDTYGKRASFTKTENIPYKTEHVTTCTTPEQSCFTNCTPGGHCFTTCTPRYVSTTCTTREHTSVRKDYIFACR